MVIKIFAVHIIKFKISHNYLRSKIIINYFESRHNLLHPNIIGEIKKQIVDEWQNKLICTSSYFSLGTA